MCLDTGRIGISKDPKSKFVSGYWKNRDKKWCKEQICVWILEDSGQEKVQRVNLCLDTRGIETSEGPKSKYVSGYWKNRDKQGCKEQICVWILEESGQARVQRANMCLDTGRIGTRKGARSKYVSGYWKNRDKKKCKEQICVWIPGESGQEKVQGANMCLDTGRIGTSKNPKSKFMSGYWKNRDKQGCKEQICVSIPGESGQARVQRANMCLDTRRIGTSKGPKRKFMSGYWKNRDKQGCKEQICVWILEELGQEKGQRANMCLDTGRIGTSKGAKSKYVSGYWKNRDKRGCKEQICVWIPGESGQKRCKEQICVWILEESGQARVQRANMCLDTGRIGTRKGARSKYVSGYRKNRDKQGSKKQICVWILEESGQEKVQRANMCLDTRRIGTSEGAKSKYVSRYRKNWIRICYRCCNRYGKSRKCYRST